MAWGINPLASSSTQRYPWVPTSQRYPWVPTSGGSSPAAPSSGDGSRSFYTDAKQDLQPLLDPYFNRVSAGHQDSVRHLADAIRADGYNVEVSDDGLLMRFPGHDYGWIDIRRDKAQVEGRRGWDQAAWTIQPFYSREDFDRLVSEGRNPHTGEFVGYEQAKLYTRHSDTPMGGNALTGSGIGGALTGGAAFAGMRPRSKRDPMAGRQGTILAGMNAARPQTQRRALYAA